MGKSFKIPPVRRSQADSALPSRRISGLSVWHDHVFLIPKSALQGGLSFAFDRMVLPDFPGSSALQGSSIGTGQAALTVLGIARS